MPISWGEFDDRQDEDLVRALARQEMNNRQGLGIAAAFESQRSGRVDDEIKRDTLENNAEYRREMTDNRRSRTAAEVEERQSRIDERSLNERERVAALAEADRILGDPNADPDAKRAAQAVKLRLKPSVSIADNPAPRMVPVTRVNPRTGRVDTIGETQSDAKMVQEPAPPANASTGGLNPYQMSQTIRGMAKDYRGATKDFQTITRQRGNMRAAMDRWASGDTTLRDAAGQAILVGFQKVLDPDSVVRETEYARSEQGQPFFDRIKAKWLQMTSGGPTVTDAALKEYVSMIDEFYRLAEQHAAAEHARVKVHADMFKIPMEAIVAGQAPSAAPPAADAPVAKPAPAPGPAKPKFELLPD